MSDQTRTKWLTAKLLQDAADKARTEADPRWHAVADLLDSEADDLAEFTDTSKPLGYAARHIHHDFEPAIRAARALVGEA